MYIKSLELNNFQAHEHLTLTFNESVTVICGPSSVGKSCIRRGISFLFFGEPHSDFIRKIGTKQTSVKAVLSTGWEIERIKSASINRIILRKDGQEKTFDSIGANIPEEVQKVLEVRELEIDKETINLNISKQLTLPFLYDKPATFRAKIFNMLTGNDLIDKVIQIFNKELLSISRDSKVENEFICTNEPQLSSLKVEIDTKTTIYNNLEKLIKQIKDNYKRLKELQQLELKLASNKEMCEKCTLELQKYSKSIDEKKLEEIKVKNGKLEILKNLAERSRLNDNARKGASIELSKIKLPALNTKEIAGSINRLANLKTIFGNLKDNWQSIEANRENLTNIYQIYDNLIEKYREIVKQAPVCKACGQLIQSENIIKQL